MLNAQEKEEREWACEKPDEYAPRYRDADEEGNGQAVGYDLRRLLISDGLLHNVSHFPCADVDFFASSTMNSLCPSSTYGHKVIISIDCFQDEN